MKTFRRNSVILGCQDLSLLGVKLMCRQLLELLDFSILNITKHSSCPRRVMYSFGIVLLEIITNQLVIDQTRQRPHIAEWVRFVLTTGDIKSIMDPNLNGNYDSSSAWKILELAMLCPRPSSAERPNMAQIVHELHECLMYDNSRRGRNQDVSPKSSNEVSTSTDGSCGTLDQEGLSKIALLLKCFIDHKACQRFYLYRVNLGKPNL